MMKQRLGVAREQDFELSVATERGNALRAALVRLATQVADEQWQFSEVELSPPSIAFTARDDRLTVRIEPGGEHAYARTEYFTITYKGPSDLSASALALVDRCVGAVHLAESDRSWRDTVRRPTLSRVSYYPSAQRLELRPSLVCNHSCGFCNSVDRTGTDNAARGTDDIFENLEAIIALPVTVVAISGGEPTLQKRLPELVRRLAERGVEVELQTNGMALGDPAYAAKLRDAGLSRVLISLHSANAEQSDAKITRYEGGWQQTVAGIDEAIRVGFRVDLSHVIHAHNGSETKHFLEFVKGRWGKKVFIRMAFVAPTGAARAAAREYIPPIQDVVPSLVPALEFARREKLRVQFVGYCGIPPCLLQPEHEFSDVVRISGAREYNENHMKLPACATCRYDNRCPGLWAKYHELHGDPGLRPM